MAQNTAISGTGGSKIPWQWAKESLSDVEFENIYFFRFCASPDPAIVTNLFADLLEILISISCEFT